MSFTFQDRKNASPDYGLFCVLAEQRFTSTSLAQLPFQASALLPAWVQRRSRTIKNQYYMGTIVDKKCVPGSEITNLRPISPSFE